LPSPGLPAIRVTLPFAILPSHNQSIGLEIIFEEIFKKDIFLPGLILKTSMAVRKHWRLSWN
jgi:hypothetical protein